MNLLGLTVVLAALALSVASLAYLWLLRRRGKLTSTLYRFTTIGVYAVIAAASIGLIVVSLPINTSFPAGSPIGTTTTISDTAASDTSAAMPTETISTTGTMSTTETTGTGMISTGTTGTAMTSTATGTLLTTTGTETAGTTETAGAAAAADVLREWLAKGAAAFNPKKEMKQGQAETVTLRILSDGNDPRRAEPLPGGPTTFVWPQDVSKVMRAELSGEGFKVRSDSPLEQYLRNGLYEWAWTVTPIEYGNRELLLTISTLAPFSGMGEKASVAHIERRAIRVHVSPVFVASTVVKLHWQWGVTAIAIPLIVWLWSKWPEKKRRAGF